MSYLSAIKKQSTQVAAPPVTKALKVVGESSHYRNGKLKLETADLIRWLDEGLSPRAISLKANCTERTVRKRIAKLSAEHKYGALHTETADGTPFLNSPEQMIEINKLAHKILNSKQAKADPDLALRTMTRIEKQNQFQLQLSQLMNSIKAIQSFQATVFEVLDSVDPAVKAEVIRKLKERKQVMGALNP